jgi:antitoxin (DNA-binding transcriptional repressor) of toxin-antitoxin stability system
LRAALPDAIRRASIGELTVITAHGRPVAQLGPLESTSPRLDQLVATGAVIAPRRLSEWRPPAPVPIWSGVRIDRALRELRG